MAKFAIIGLLLLAVALSCAPLQITSIKIIDDNCGCACVSWETNFEAQCKITYCERGMCYTSPLEPEYSTLHSYGFPMSSDRLHDVNITAIGPNGQTCMEVIP
jgi:hypothetical protein